MYSLNPKPSTQLRAAKTNGICGKESESIYKPFNQQKGVTRSVYCEHWDMIDQFTLVPASHQKLKYGQNSATQYATRLTKRPYNMIYVLYLIIFFSFLSTG
jgi:hypothetical protein